MQEKVFEKMGDFTFTFTKKRSEKCSKSNPKMGEKIIQKMAEKFNEKAIEKIGEDVIEKRC